MRTIGPAHDAVAGWSAARLELGHGQCEDGARPDSDRRRRLARRRPRQLTRFRRRRLRARLRLRRNRAVGHDRV